MADQRFRFLKSEVALIDSALETARKDTPYFESLLRKRRSSCSKSETKNAPAGGTDGNNCRSQSASPGPALCSAELLFDID